MACEGGLLCMALIGVHCNDFDSYVGGNIHSSYGIVSLDENVYHSMSRQRLC